MSPKNEQSDKYNIRGLTLREVEVEHIKTTIIALHEEYKVVEDLHRDVKNYRDKEENHKEGVINLKDFTDHKLKV